MRLGEVTVAADLHSILSKSGTCVQSGDTSTLGRDRTVAESIFCYDNGLNRL